MLVYGRNVAKEVLQNPEYDAPTFWINPDIKNLEDFTVDDFRLDNYKSTKYEGKIPVAV